MDEREAKVAQNSKLFQRPGHANKNIGSTTIIYIQGDQTRNTILISLSLSINRIALLFIWKANQYKGGKKSHKKSRKEEKRVGKKRRKGSRREW